MSLSQPPFSVCTYCASRNGARPAYATAAEAFGRALAGHGWRLVYGGGDVGLMGVTARAVMAAGGETFGVVPQHLIPVEKGSRALTRLVVTHTMHERKQVMAMNADAFVLLPGGAGSLDEFFEILTWHHLGLHAKPIFVLDVEGVWRPLAALIAHLIAEGFADPPLRDRFRMVPDVPALMAGLEVAARVREPQDATA